MIHLLSRRGHVLVACFSLIAAGGANAAETPWPEIAQTAKPWTRWWWPGSAVDEANLTYQLESFANAGLGGVEVTPIYGVRGAENREIPFLSERWMQMLVHASREAKRLGLGVDMATGTGWPFGGPKVDVQDATHTLTLVDGRLTGTPTDMKVKRAAPGGEGLVLDPYSTSGLQKYLESFSQAFAQYPQAQIRGQFHDSFEYYGASWTTSLPQAFERLHGYDIQDHAAVLADEASSDVEARSRIKSDYRATLAQLHLDYLREWTEWSHKHGFVTRNQSHGAPANLLDLYGAVDIPETESFGSSAFAIPGLRRDPRDVRQDHTPPHPLVYRMASSAAHVMGKPLISSESGTWLREHWKESPAALKPQLDQLFVAGINHIFYHGTVYTPRDASWPGWYFYASTQLSLTNPLWDDFAAFNDYVARTQSILQSGTSDNDVLIYWPFHDAIDDPRDSVLQLGVENAHWLLDSPTGRLAATLDAKGYAFDFISDAQLLQTRFEKNELHTPGHRYRAIVVPATRRMPVATLAHLRKLVEQGATVLFEALPEDVPGFGRLGERRAQLERLRADPKLAKAIVGSDMHASLKARGIAREPIADLGLSFIRRANDNGFDYFIANLGAKRIDRWVELGRTARDALLMDPLTARFGRAQVRTSDSATQIYLQLEPGESTIVRTRPTANAFASIDEWAYFRAGDPIVLNGNWETTFVSGGPTLPDALVTSQLQSWTDLAGEEGQRFAGTARYRLELEVTSREADAWLLDLGDVREAARVRLDGKDVGAVCCLPYRIRLGALERGRHILEIDVTSSAANRIRDLDRRKVAWRTMKDADIVNIHYRPFAASEWDIAPSGLLGPVTLVPLQKLKP